MFIKIRYCIHFDTKSRGFQFPLRIWSSRLQWRIVYISTNTMMKSQFPLKLRKIRENPLKIPRVVFKYHLYLGWSIFTEKTRQIATVITNLWRHNLCTNDIETPHVVFSMDLHYNFDSKNVEGKCWKWIQWYLLSPHSLPIGVTRGLPISMAYSWGLNK